MNDVQELLRAAAPTPRGAPDVAAAIRRGRTRRLRHRATGALLVLALLGAGLAGYRTMAPATVASIGTVSGSGAVADLPDEARGLPGPEDADDGDGWDLYVMDRPERPDDGMPPWTWQTPARDGLVSPSSMRLAGRVGQRSFYVGAGADGSLCLVLADADARTSTGACLSERDFVERGHLPLEVATDQQRTWAAVVPNGWARATAGRGQVAITENLVVFDPIAGSTRSVRLLGTDGRTRDLPVEMGADAQDHSRPADAPSPEPLPGTYTAERGPDPERCAFLTELADLTPAQAGARVEELGYVVEWHYMVPIDSPTAFGGGTTDDGEHSVTAIETRTEVRSSPPIGVVADATAGYEPHSYGPDDPAVVTVLVTPAEPEYHRPWACAPAAG